MDIKEESEFRGEIISRMNNEVAAQEKELTKESMYETLLKTNSFQSPKATINEQADLMRKDALMRIGHSEENAGDDLFPIDSFLEKAEKRVKLDLLFAELINHFEIKVEKQQVDDFIEEESKRYKDQEPKKAIFCFQNLFKMNWLTENDFTIGDENAPITIIEYASMSCSHCANFHTNTLPELKKEYIDTGKFRKCTKI